MPCWIFVVSVDKKEFRERIANKEWPIYKLTKNREKLRAGDKAIIYLAGLGRRKFVGNCTLNSAIKKKENGPDYSVDLTQITIWKKHLDVYNVLADLVFVKNKDHWGGYFQGGVVTISEKDYQLILSNVK